MGKSPITEVHSKTLSGILDLDTMTMDFEEIGKKSLKDLLDSFDGENVKITVNLKNEVID